MSLTQRGFTLIEVIVSILLLSFLMLGVYQITDNSTTTKTNTVREDRHFSEFFGALQRLETDLSHIYSPLYFEREYDPTKDEVQTSDNDESYYDRIEEISNRFPRYSQSRKLIPTLESTDSSFIFYTQANQRKVSTDKQSRFAWIRYEWRGELDAPDPDEIVDPLKFKYPSDSISLIRYYSPRNPYEKDFNWEEIKGQVVLRGIKSLKFKYWNPQTEKFVESLESLGKARYLLRGISLEIEWYESSESTIKLNKIFRPLWPEFNVLAETKMLDQKREQAMSEVRSENGRNGGRNNVEPRR